MGNLIYTSDENVKNKLLKYGYPLLKESNGMFIFANVKPLLDKYDDIATKITYSNIMSF